MNILDQYIMSYPSHQNAVDLFKEEWSSKIPGPYDSGSIPLFNDSRINLIANALNGINNKSILELGPLEGAHTEMVLRLGSGRVTSIEANSRAYIKCLITKEILSLKNCEFLLGNFDEYLEQENQNYDLILALGVIYHCKNPVKTITNLCKRSKEVGIWSHYYDEEKVKAIYGRKFNYKPQKISYGELSSPCYEHHYQDALDIKGFCGGGNQSTFWMKKCDWQELFDSQGFNLNILEEQVDHPNGPSFTAVAKKID